jgi:hypothetical protein
MKKSFTKSCVGRFTLIANNIDEIYETIKYINSTLVIRDTNGNLMNAMKFDIKRATM